MKGKISAALAVLGTLALVGMVNYPEAGVLSMGTAVLMIVQYPVYTFYQGYRSPPTA